MIAGRLKRQCLVRGCGVVIERIDHAMCKLHFQALSPFLQRLVSDSRHQGTSADRGRAVAAALDYLDAQSLQTTLFEQ